MTFRRVFGRAMVAAGRCSSTRLAGMLLGVVDHPSAHVQAEVVAEHKENKPSAKSIVVQSTPEDFPGKQAEDKDSFPHQTEHRLARGPK